MMAGDIKPIETHYNGYRFRSRLEARWAVFFDAIGWGYDYEPEGFDLGGQGWYLPDFALYGPNLPFWVDIKPFVPNPESELNVYMGKLSATCDAKTPRSPRKPSGLLLVGNVGENPACGISVGASEMPFQYVFGFIQCPLCAVVTMFITQDGLSYRVVCECSTPRGVHVNVKHVNIRTFTHTPFLVECHQKARGARFEHGETPTTALQPVSIIRPNVKMRKRKPNG